MLLNERARSAEIPGIAHKAQGSRFKYNLENKIRK
jgi:hypothetical protein